jgi:hypothetical protein
MLLRGFYCPPFVHSFLLLVQQEKPPISTASLEASRCAKGAAIPVALLQTCRSAIVKSFGRRRRTKVSEERTRGPQTMVYGYFCFRLSLATSRPAVGSAGRDAICPNRRCIGWRCRWGSPARGGFEASLTTDGANSTVGRNGGVAAGNCGRPCRVTANFSRLVECSAVVRGADASARTSR